MQCMNEDQMTSRIQTFSDFPSNVPVCTYRLANFGFKYTGIRDRVKCNSCRNEIENWQPGEDGELTLRKRHKTNCVFAKRNRESPRSHQTGADVLNSIPAMTARLAYVSLNAHRIANGRDVVPPEDCVDTSSQPANSSMSSLADRWESFQKKITNWTSSYRHGVTPEKFAEAGLYYSGKKDRLRCWYCDGKLCNWEKEDDPWVEHTKWYSNCPFVLQNKSAEFVEKCKRLAKS